MVALSSVPFSAAASAAARADDALYVLLASDGLWDVATDEDAVLFALQWLSSNPPGTARQGDWAENVSALLETLQYSAVRGGAGGDDRLAALCASMSRWAAERGSGDDISIVCVELNAADWAGSDQVSPSLCLSHSLTLSHSLSLTLSLSLSISL